MLIVDDVVSFIVQRIVRLREARGISARDLSLSIGTDKNYINRIETLTTKPSIEGLVFICEYFEITIQEFFDDGTDRPLREKELLAVIRKLDDETFGYLLGIATKLSENKK